MVYVPLIYKDIIGIKQKLFLLLSFLYIVWLTFPLASFYVSISSGVLNFIVFSSLLLLYPKAFAYKAFYWAMAYLFVLLLYVDLGKEIPVGGGNFTGFRRFLIEAAFILPALAIFFVLEFEKNIKLYRAIAFAAIISLTASFIVVIPYILVNEDVLRSTAEGEFRNTIPGIPYYSLVHAYSLLLVPLMYVVKSVNNKGLLGVTWFFIGLLSFIVYSSKVTTILLILLFSFAWFLLNKESAKKMNSLLVIILFLFLLLYVVGIIDMLLDGFAELFKSNEMYYRKVKAITLSLQNSQGSDTYSVDIRKNLHLRSWTVFLSNPLTGGPDCGGHSGLLDRLGGLGLLGFIPFIMMFLSVCKMVISHFSTSFQRRYYIAAVIMAVLLLYEKGIFGQEGWLFLFVLCPSIMALGLNSVPHSQKIRN